MAVWAEECGADWLGLVFAPSRRKVDTVTAKAIASNTPHAAKVGVFANAPLAEVEEIARECRLDMVQLHGDEDADYCRRLSRPVIKAFRADSQLTAEYLDEFPARYLLLDSFTADQFGGLGVPFDWSGLQQLRRKLTKPLLIAGGLNSVNVQTAMDILRPDGVDVSGGVETNGRKDRHKIAAFAAAVRGGR